MYNPRTTTILRCLWVLWCICTVKGLFAQQEPQYTQYMYNPTIINPAYVGTVSEINFNGTHRSQWTGVEGAPSTQSFAVSTYAGRNVGLGISILNDEIGPAQTLNATADFAYNLVLGRRGYTNLSFGLKGGIKSLNVDFNKLTISDLTEISEFQNVNTISTQLGLGVFLYQSNWYMGVSVPNILQTRHYDEVRVALIQDQMHFYTIAGYIFDLSDKLLFKPSVLLKAVNGAPLSTEASANFLWNDVFTLGAAYRFGSAINLLTAFQISPSIMIGYAYDFDSSQFTGNSSGSQELFLRFQLNRSQRGKISPRFF